MSKLIVKDTFGRDLNSKDLKHKRKVWLITRLFQKDLNNLKKQLKIKK